MNSLIVTGIYKLTNVINGKVYIGQSKDIGQRMKYHIQDSQRPNDPRGQYPLYDDMRLHGHDNFKLEILEKCKIDNLDERERHFIEKYDATNIDKGYNLTKEACLCSLMSDDEWRFPECEFILYT